MYPDALSSAHSYEGKTETRDLLPQRVHTAPRASYASFPLLLLVHMGFFQLLPLFLGLFLLLSAVFLEFLLSLPFLLLKFLLSLSPLPLKFLPSLMPLLLKFLLFYLPLFVEGFLLLLLLLFVLVLLVSRFCLKSSRELLLLLLKLCFLIPILLLILFFLFLPYLLSAFNLNVVQRSMFFFLVTVCLVPGMHEEITYFALNGLLLEPVRADSPSPNWTEARIVGLWLQLMCCACSVIQPWDFGDRYRPKAEIT
jgi:hypothetical protein